MSWRGINFSQENIKYTVPIWEKDNLTVDEAAAYTGIGMSKIHELTDDENCKFMQ